MHTSTYSTKRNDLSTTGKVKGSPELIGSLLGELGSEMPTSSKSKMLQEGINASKSQMLSQVIHRFFKALKAIYGSKFDQQFSSAVEVDQSKLMWGEDITVMNDIQLKACLVNAKRMIRSGHKDYLWPNIGLILGFIQADSSWKRQSHKLYIPRERQIEDLTDKEANNKVGSEHLAGMKALFS